MIEPHPPDQWDASLAAIRDSLPNPLNIHRIIAHHPALLNAYWPLRQHAIYGSVLSPRQTELLILRTGVLCSADYEIEHHIRRSRKVGLTEAEIDAILGGTFASFSAEDQLFLHAADQLHENQRLSAAVRDQLVAQFGVPIVLDAIYTVGVYFTLAGVLKTFDVPFEGDATAQKYP